MDFTKVISRMYSNMEIKMNSYPSTIMYIDPIIKLTKEQEQKLLKGDGQSNPNEYKQVNSSTGLAVNYYKILESTRKISELKFEDKIEKPLSIKGGRKANLDVSFVRDGKQYYVESKFLEPYYSGNEHNRDAYFQKENYAVPEKDKDAWLQLLNEAQGFKLYNFSQICRHLLAIWRIHDKRKSYVFQSVTWKMSDLFIENLEDDTDKEFYQSRRFKIEEESKSCQEKVRDFLKRIEWNNLAFECLHYDDLLSDIESSEFYEIFKKRYFMD